MDEDINGGDLEFFETEAETDPPEEDTEDLTASAAQPTGLQALVAEVKEAEQEAGDDGETAVSPEGSDAGPAKVRFSWVLPMVILLLAVLPALGLAIGNGYIAVPALRGMGRESQKRMNSAQDAYAEAYQRASKAEETRLKFFSVTSVNGSETATASGFSIGSFAAVRVALLQRKVYGPLESAEMVNSFVSGGARIPRRMQSLVAEFEEYYGLNEDLNRLYEESAETGEDDAQGFLEAIETFRKEDPKADARADFYDYYICLMSADDPERFGSKAAELKAAGREPWIYERAERYLALKAKDYAAVERIGGDRLARDKEDTDALTDQVRALWLQDKKNEAYALAEAKQNGLLMREAAKLARAELLYRDARYDEADALCDEVIAAANAAPASDSSRGFREAEAASVKAISLMLAGKAKEAAALLRATVETDYVQQGQIPLSFYYAILAATYVEDQELYRMTAQQLEYYGYAVPQEIMDLHILYTATVADIYQTGWGVVA